MNPTEFAAAVKSYEGTKLTAQVQAGPHTLGYLTPNAVCLWRVQTLFTKEPHTIQWLNSFPEGGVFLDVGANVGMYSVYVGVVRGARIYAFEPEAQNYSLLCKNLILNNLGARSTAWCAALLDETKFDKIYLSSLSVGGSCHSFGEQVDAYLKPVTFEFAQGCYATTIDRLVADGALEPPTYIKIDVDGFEHKIIKGAAATLRNPAVKSLLIEVNSHLPEHMMIVDFLGELGFKHDPQQFLHAQRNEGAFKGVGEYVFRR